jgi:hypothetical protein
MAPRFWKRSVATLAVLLANAVLIGGVLTWLGTAIAVAMALDDKGRSAFGGFLCAIFLPIPAVIYAIAAPSRR